jgi:hypothetical protein
MCRCEATLRGMRRGVSKHAGKNGEMYRYRLTLADGVYHYFKGDSASDVRRRFRSAHPGLPAILRVKRLGLAD